MAMESIIVEIDSQIAKLQEARALLSGTSAKSKPGPKPKGGTGFEYGANAKPKRRKISKEGRRKIALAQKKRWAAIHAAQKAKA
jgi:hypothetical protein